MIKEPRMSLIGKTSMTLLATWLSVWSWGQPPSSHWPFDEGSGTTVVDVYGNFNGTVDGAQWSDGVMGSALSFDGTNDRVSMTGPGLMGSSFTVTCWFKADDFDVTDARLISRAQGTSQGDHDWMLSTVSSGGSSVLRARLRTNGSTKTLIASGGALSTGTWTHAAFVYNGSTMQLYKDGVLVGSANKSGAVDERTGLSVAVGNQPNGAGSRAFDGLIDDMRIYGRALSVSEIEALANPCDGTPVASFSADLDQPIAPATASFDASASSDCDGSLTAFEWDFGDGSTGSGMLIDHTYQEPGMYAITLNVTDDSGLTASTSRQVAVSDGIPLDHWTFDEGSGATAHDIAGSFHGTLEGATWSEGLFGDALDFDGSDDRVAMAGPGISGDAMSIAIWFYADDFGTQDARLISRASGTNSGDHDWMLSTISDGGTMRLRARLRTNGSTKTLIASSGWCCPPDGYTPHWFTMVLNFVCFRMDNRSVQSLRQDRLTNEPASR